MSSGSGGTSGESRATGSSSAHGNVDVYDVKFQGMDVVDHGGSKPQDNGNATQLLDQSALTLYMYT